MGGRRQSKRRSRALCCFRAATATCLVHGIPPPPFSPHPHPPPRPLPFPFAPFPGCEYSQRLLCTAAFEWHGRVRSPAVMTVQAARPAGGYLTSCDETTHSDTTSARTVLVLPQHRRRQGRQDHVGRIKISKECGTANLYPPAPSPTSMGRVDYCTRTVGPHALQGASGSAKSTLSGRARFPRDGAVATVCQYSTVSVLVQ